MFSKILGKLTGKKNRFNKKFGNVTIKTVQTKNKGLCLQASYGKDAKIIMEFCENDQRPIPDGANAYFFGNKLIIVTRWSDMSDEEKQKVEKAELALAIHPYECAQLSMKVGENWGDVIVTLHHCCAELNDEDAPVDEVIFLFADTEDASYLTCRSVLLPTFIQKFLQRCNVNSHKMLDMDSFVKVLRTMVGEDSDPDFYDCLYDECWERTKEFYEKVETIELDDIPDGVYIEIDSSNKVTKAYQND